jgi:hypothetical protein
MFRYVTPRDVQKQDKPIKIGKWYIYVTQKDELVFYYSEYNKNVNKNCILIKPLDERSTSTSNIDLNGFVTFPEIYNNNVTELTSIEFDTYIMEINPDPETNEIKIMRKNLTDPTLKSRWFAIGYDKSFNFYFDTLCTGLNSVGELDIRETCTLRGHDPCSDLGPTYFKANKDYCFSAPRCLNSKLWNISYMEPKEMADFQRKCKFSLNPSIDICQNDEIVAKSNQYEKQYYDSNTTLYFYCPLTANVCSKFAKDLECSEKANDFYTGCANRFGDPTIPTQPTYDYLLPKKFDQNVYDKWIGPNRVVDYCKNCLKNPISEFSNFQKSKSSWCCSQEGETGLSFDTCYSLNPNICDPNSNDFVVSKASDCRKIGKEPCISKKYLETHSAECRALGYEACKDKGYLETHSAECRTVGYEACKDTFYRNSKASECRSVGYDPCNLFNTYLLNNIDECRNNGVDPCNNINYLLSHSKECRNIDKTKFEACKYSQFQFENYQECKEAGYDACNLSSFKQLSQQNQELCGDYWNLCSNPTYLSQNLEKCRTKALNPNLAICYTNPMSNMTGCFRYEPCVNSQYRLSNPVECRKYGFEPCYIPEYLNNNQQECMPYLDCRYETIFTKYPNECRSINYENNDPCRYNWYRTLNLSTCNISDLCKSSYRTNTTQNAIQCRNIGIDPCDTLKWYTDTTLNSDLNQVKNQCRNIGYEPCNYKSYKENNPVECSTKTIKHNCNNMDYWGPNSDLCIKFGYDPDNILLSSGINLNTESQRLDYIRTSKRMK